MNTIDRSEEALWEELERRVDAVDRTHRELAESHFGVESALTIMLKARMRDAIKLSGLTTAQVAAKAGMTRQGLHGILNSDAPISTATIAKVLAATGTRLRFDLFRITP